MAPDSPQDGSRDEPTDDAPPTLFDSHPQGIARAAALGAGGIAVGTIAVEILTDRWLARTLNYGIGFVSLPMGVATVFLAGVCGRANVRSALPAVALSAVYWGLFVAYL